jgi:hypothetical protein
MNFTARVVLLTEAKNLLSFLSRVRTCDAAQLRNQQRLSREPRNGPREHRQEKFQQLAQAERCRKQEPPESSSWCWKFRKRSDREPNPQRQQEEFCEVYEPHSRREEVVKEIVIKRLHRRDRPHNQR